MDKKLPSRTAESRRYRRWLCLTLALTLLLLALFALPTVYIDPLFHYHAPLEQYQYPITNERYQNDGIVRHFSYDGIITGTSMAENFKTSEADALFGGSFIKVPFSGGRYKEVDDNLRRAYTSRQTIRFVIRSLDLSMLIADKDAVREDFHFPLYLYNNNPFDDVNYFLNKSIFLNYTLAVPEYTKDGNPSTTFDSYMNWNDSFSFGSQFVLDSYTFTAAPESEVSLTDEDRTLIQENLQQNVIDLALAHPETTFYLFFPPYSVAYWGDLNNKGELRRMLDAEQLAIETLIAIPNIQLFSFFNNYGMVCNLDNYRDIAHYGEWVNSWILEQLAADNYRLTPETIQEYLDTTRAFYTSYDYTALNDLK